MLVIASDPPGSNPQRKLTARPKVGTQRKKQAATPDLEDNGTEQRVVRRMRSPQHSSSPVSESSTSYLYAPSNETAVDDAQMFAAFYELYYPPSVEFWRDATYLRSLVDSAPTTVMLKRARRTCGLVHLAAVTRDARLIRESRISYGRLLGMLQFSLMFPSKIQTQVETREMIASIALLSHMSDSPVAGVDLDDAWVSHLGAAQEVYCTHIPVALPDITPVDQGLMRHVFMHGFFLALAKRKAQISKVDTVGFLKSSGWTVVIPAYHRLPGLLEETDTALERKADVVTILKLVAQLQGILEETSGLFADLQNSPTVSSSSISSLDSTAEEHLVMADSTTFPRMYVPMPAAGASDMLKLLYTTKLSLLIHCTLLRIWHFRPETLGAAPETAHRDAEETAYRLARRLCMLALSLTQNDKLVYISTLRFVLLLARNVFEQQDRRPEMGWCEACLIANQMRMERVRPAAVPTLCKVADITPGLAEAGRYKMRFDPRAFVVRAPLEPSMRLLA